MKANCLLQLALFALVLVLRPPFASADQTAPHLPAASDIVEKLETSNARRAQALRTYRSTRIYEVSYRGFGGNRQASMVVNATFESPTTKKFDIVSEQGSKLLRNRVLHKLLTSEQEAAEDANRAETALNSENYHFELTGTETLDGHTCFVLQVTPRRKNKFLYDGRIWVDSQDYAVVRIEAAPARNPSFWITRTAIQHSYVKRGNFWLPERNESHSHIRLGGDAVLTINYGDYVINTPQFLAPAK